MFNANESDSWLIGGAFHYGRSDIDGVADAGGGSADVDQYTFKAFATYIKDNGSFVDLVLHTGYYDTELTGLNNTKSGYFKADYSNWGYGLSAEIGHRFEFAKNDGWYVEPTAQLTWFHADGKTFKTSTGLEIRLSNADFLTGRLGTAVEKTFALGTEADPYGPVSREEGSGYTKDYEASFGVRYTF